MAAGALAAGITAAAVPAARAAAKPSIRAYVDTWNMSLDGMAQISGPA
jgi:hypothetical protein